MKITMLVYQPRFVRPSDTMELINLYHLAKVPLSGKECTPHARMLWASSAFAKEHPYITSSGAYKDLCGMLE
jgi:hypothetical protein